MKTKFLNIATRFACVAAMFLGCAGADAAITGTVRTIGGSYFAGFVDGDNFSSLFNQPSGLAVDENGNVLVADAGNNAVRIVDPATEVTSTFSVAGLNNPVGLAIEASGNVLVANFGSANVVRLSRFNGGVLATIGAGQLTGPTAVAVDVAGNIYVAQTDGRVRRFAAAGGLVSETYVAAGAGSLRGLAILGNDLYASDAQNHVIWRWGINAPTVGGVVLAGSYGVAGFADGAKDIGRFNTPQHLDILTNGVLVVADRFNHRIRAVNNAGVISTLYGADPAVWQGLPSEFLPGWLDGASATAELREPVGVAAADNGTVFDSEVFYGLIRKASGVTFPTNSSTPPLLPLEANLTPSSGFFPNGVQVLVTSRSDPAGGFPATARIFYTLNNTEPGPGNASSQQAILSGGVGTISLTGPVDLSGLRVRVFNGDVAGTEVRGGVTGPGTPALDPAGGIFATGARIIVTNLDSADGLFPAAARLFYTTNSTTPTLASFEGVITNGIGVINIVGPIDLATLRVRIFIGATGGAVTSGTVAPPTPNSISLGFASGEASSDFVGSPGQTFFSPVTLTVRPEQRMYGLQFNVTVNPISAPIGDFAPNFFSLLVKPLPDGGYRRIPPATYVRTDAFVTTQIVNGLPVQVTNFVQIFSNLVTSVENFVGVGWLERGGATNLYDTLSHDLIRYSLPHDNLFLSPNGKVVAGAYNFTVPGTATTGNSYRVRVGRPSANSDGVSGDVVIDTPDWDLDENLEISANRVLTIINPGPQYIVGDLAPFRWFNAGDFGNNVLLNNDMQQIQQSVIYGVNLPPRASDMFDAIDSCCNDINNVPIASSSEFIADSRAVINTIARGDGVLSLADLYVSFRRSLDPSLSNFARFWENGVRRSVAVPNNFRSSASDVPVPAKGNKVLLAPDPTLVSQPQAVRFRAQTLRARAGETMRVPITARVSGQHTVRSMLLRVSAIPLDGASTLSSITFFPSTLIGPPLFGGSGSDGTFGGSWLDMGTGLPAGEHTLGTLEFAVPPHTSPNAVFSVRIERAEASPNGIFPLPITTEDSVIIMENRPISWDDEIPDSWRVQYFGSLENILSARDGDADADGMTNYEEFVAGTNPTDINSRLALSAGQTSVPVLAWPSVSGKRYRLESSTTLINGSWTIVEDQIAGNGGLILRTPPRGTSQSIFYRVHVIE